MNKPDYDIVILPLPRWDARYSSTAWSLAKALSAFTRVFYIDKPFTMKDYIVFHKSEQVKKRRNALIKGEDIFVVPDKNYPNLVVVVPQLVLPINWAPEGGLFDYLSSVNDRIVFKALDKMFDRYGINKFVFINSFNPVIGKYFPKRFNPLLTIYHCVDDISNSDYVSKHGTRLEDEMIKKADITLVTSMELKRMKERISPKVYYHPNAANVELFREAVEMGAPRPAEYEKLQPGRPVIFYMGNICHRVDYELLLKITTRFPDHYLMMVGPLGNDNYRKAGLDKLPNVIFTGSRKLEELPAYVHHSSICIIPFLCIPLTKSIYPLKINEYLSAGKPVVTTNFSEDIAKFASVAYVSGSHEEFLDNLADGLATDTPELASKRIAYASGNNWDARASGLIEIIDQNLVVHEDR